MTAKRVLLAGLYHETHTFLDGLTSLPDCLVRTGEEMLQPSDDASPLAGVAEAASAYGWDLLPAVDVRAIPGPTISDDVVQRFWQGLCAAAGPEGLTRFDGVFLVLHGAMVSESYCDVEGEVLSRIARLPGASGTRVCGVLDLHANFTRAMADHSDGLIAYRENPHTDAKDAARRGCEMLDRLMASHARTVTVWEHPPLMWPPTGTATADEPLRSLEALAREIECESPGIAAVNVLAGFAFADISDAGVSFTAVTRGDPDAAKARLQEMANLAWRDRDTGVRLDLPPDRVMEMIKHHSGGPLVVAEPSDNIGAGAPGDGTGLLRELVTNDIQDAVVAINDPGGVEMAAAKAIGDTFTLAVGGKGSSLDEGPLVLRVKLASTSDGRFSLEDPKSHLASLYGSQIEMGQCAVVHYKGITILLTSRKTPPFDLGQHHSQGIYPERMRVVGVKAAVAHRRAYDPIAGAHCSVDTPGPCASDVRKLPYRRVRRPVYPLDP